MTINRLYKAKSDLPDVIPVFPLTGVLLLPKSQLPLNIFEPRYLEMTDSSIASHRLIGMIQPVNDAEPSDPAPKLEMVGCVGRITQFGETGDGRYMMTLTGVVRFRIVQELAFASAFRQCRVSYDEFIGDLAPADVEIGADRTDLHRMLKLFEQAKGLNFDWKSVDETPDAALVDALAMKLPFDRREKQALLEAQNLTIRTRLLIAIAEMESAQKSGGSTRLQ